MKKNAFTLIELLGVLVLLSLLLIIIFPSIINSIKKVNNNNDEVVEKLVISAAKDYYDKNKSSIKFENAKYCINIQKLINDNSISEDIFSKDISYSKNGSVILTDGNPNITYEISNDSCVSN